MGQNSHEAHTGSHGTHTGSHEATVRLTWGSHGNHTPLTWACAGLWEPMLAHTALTQAHMAGSARGTGWGVTLVCP